MSARALLVGAAAGSLAAVGVWHFGSAPAPLEASGTGVPFAARAKTAPALLPVAAGEQRASPTAAARTDATAAPDPEFGVLAFGRVVDAAGVPVSGAAPRFEDDQAFVHEASSGPGGTWSLLGLAPGELEVSVQVEGYLPYRELVVMPAVRHWRHDLALTQARSLPVRFESPAGEALAAQGFGDLRSFLGVCATRARPTSPLPGVHGRVIRDYAEGSFRTRAERNTPADLDGRYQGLLELRSAPPLWVSAVCRDVVLESRPLALDETELVFTVGEEQLAALLGEVRARLVERGTGLPIEAALELGHPSGGIRVRATLEEGDQVFRGVPPGTLDLMLQSREWEWLERSLRVPAGAILDLGTIELGRRQAFVVQVQDAAGQPLALGVEAARTELDGRLSDLNLRVNVRASTEGLAEVAHLAPGPTLLRAGGGDGWGRVAKVVDTGREATPTLVLRRGTQVVFARGSELGPGLEFVLEDAAGLPLYTGSYLRREISLAPGPYVLRVLDGALEVERVAFEVSGARLVVPYGGV